MKYIHMRQDIFYRKTLCGKKSKDVTGGITRLILYVDCSKCNELLKKGD